MISLSFFKVSGKISSPNDSCEGLIISYCLPDLFVLLYLVSIKISNRLFIKPGIQERGTECGERGECSLGFWGIPLRIPGNVIILTFRGMFKKIPGNVQKDSGECSRRFRGMFKKFPGNVPEDSGECSKRFRGMFEKIPGNVRKDSGECSKRFWGMFEKFPGNVQEESRVTA